MPKFTVKRTGAISLPTIKIPDDGSSVYIKCLGNPTVKMTKQKDDKGEMVEKEITVCHVELLATKAADSAEAVAVEPAVEGEIVVGTVLASNWEEKCDNKVQGMAFEITKIKVDGKRYRNYSIFKIEA